MFGFDDAMMVAGLGASVFGGINAANSAAASNAAMMDMFQQNIAFQRESAQNKYQWSVEDLKKAGLNPMLAYGGNGGVPAGGSSIPSLTAPGAVGASSSLATAQTALAHATVDKTEADTEAAKAVANNQNSQALVNGITIDKIKQDILTSSAQEYNLNSQGNLNYQVMTKIDNEIDKIRADTGMSLAQTQKLYSDIDRNGVLNALTNAQTGNTYADTKLKGVGVSLATYQLPGAKNVADFETKFPQLSPTLKAVGLGANSASSLSHIFK